jgi:hypothetical protein
LEAAKYIREHIRDYLPKSPPKSSTTSVAVPELALKFEGSPSKPKTPAARHSAPAALAVPSISEADNTTKTTTALNVTKPTASSSTKAVASKSTDAAALKPSKAAASSSTDAQASTTKKNGRSNKGDWETQKNGKKIYRPEKNGKNWQVVNGEKRYMGPMSASMLNKMKKQGEQTPEEYRDLHDSITNWVIPAPKDPSVAEIIDAAIYPYVNAFCGGVWHIVTAPLTAAIAVASCLVPSNVQKKMEEAADIETGTPATPPPPSPAPSGRRSLRAHPRKLVKAARQSFVSVCYAPVSVYEGARHVCASLWVAGGGKEDCCIV